MMQYHLYISYEYLTNRLVISRTIPPSHLAICCLCVQLVGAQILISQPWGNKRIPYSQISIIFISTIYCTYNVVI